MSPSQEILNSIEDRLRQLAQEIAALESARAELQGETVTLPRRAPRTPRTAKPSQPRRRRAPAKVAAAPEISEEEWVERRAAELAAQSRQAAAA